jgi:uncharacterized membrane protein YgcG
MRSLQVCIPRQEGDQLLQLLDLYSECIAGDAISDATKLSDIEVQATLKIAYQMGERRPDVQARILGTRVSGRAVANAWITNRRLVAFKNKYFANITTGLPQTLQVGRVVSQHHALASDMVDTCPWMEGSDTITNGVLCDKDARDIVECLRALRTDTSCPDIDAETYGFATVNTPLNSLAMQILAALTLLDKSTAFVSGEYQTGVDGNGRRDGSNEQRADMLLFPIGDGGGGGGGSGSGSGGGSGGSGGGGGSGSNDSAQGTTAAAGTVAATAEGMQYPAAFIELKLVMAHSKLPDVFGTLVAQLTKYCKAAKAQHTPAMRVILFVWTEQAQHTVYEYLKELFNEESVRQRRNMQGSLLFPIPCNINLSFEAGWVLDHHLLITRLAILLGDHEHYFSHTSLRRYCGPRSRCLSCQHHVHGRNAL